jgi:hypothetical protein
MLKLKNTIVLVLLLMSSACKKSPNNIEINVEVINRSSVRAENVKLYAKDFLLSDTTIIYSDSLLLSDIEVDQAHSQTWNLGRVNEGAVYFCCQLDTLVILKEIALIDGGRLWSWGSNRDVFIYNDSIVVKYGNGY